MPDRPADPPVLSRSRTAWTVALLLAVTAVVYGRSAAFDFVSFDDPTHVLNNPLMNPFTGHSLVRFWSAPYAKLFIPATFTFWGLLSRFATQANGRLDPAIFHLANVAVHAVNVVLVWFILRRLTGRTLASLLGALLFAVHPIQVEPVAWVSGMKDLFSGMWALLSLLFYLRSIRTEVFGRTNYAVATAAFAVALLAKPASVVVPVLALLCGRASGVSVRAQLKLVLPWVLISIPYVLVTQRSQSTAAAMTWNPPMVRPLVAADTAGFYLEHLLWPARLCIDYGRTPGWVLRHWQASSIGIALVAAVAVLAWKLFRPIYGLGLLVALTGTAPVTGLVPFLYQQFSTVSDRYLYLSMLGVSLCFAAAINDLRRWGTAMGSIIIFALAIRSYEQLSVWQDTRSLFVHNLSVNPSSAVSYASLGELAVKSDRPGLAASAFHSAALLDPDEPKYAEALSRTLSTLNRPTEARAWHASSLIAAAKRALQVDPKSGPAHRGLAEAYKINGDDVRAREEATIADKLESTVGR